MPPAGGMASPGPAARTRRSLAGHAVTAGLLVVAGGVVAGIVAGFIWAALAPRVQYQVYTLKPPTAYATNPETSAFIAADGLYCFVALAGGAVLGLLGYLFAIRRHRLIPMAGLIAGSVAAALITAWLGHWISGGRGFDHLLATSKPGSYIYAPISLDALGALAFWPLAAAAVVGVIELVSTFRARQQEPYSVPMPGMESFGQSDAAGTPRTARPSGSGPEWPPGSGPEWPSAPGGQPPGRHRQLPSDRPGQNGSGG